jgi:hypothetical protein
MALLQKAYLGATPLFRNTSFFEDDTALAVSSGSATVTAGASAHTKGSWSEIIASSASNSSLVVISVNAFTTATDTSTLLDIGTGASGSETAIIENIAVGGAGTANSNISYIFPVPFKIASGTRIAARIQSLVTGGKTATIRVNLINTGDYDQAPTSVDVSGTNTATSTGTAMSGASGTWVQVIASTTRAYRGVVMVPNLASNDVLNIQPLIYELGTGASASEVVIGQVENHTSNSEFVGIRAIFSPLISKAIPSGTRLAVRHNISSNPSRYGVTLIGIP